MISGVISKSYDTIIGSGIATIGNSTSTTNTGTITSVQRTAILMHAGSNTLTNSGTIRSDGGNVSGTVLGGTGDDL